MRFMEVSLGAFSRVRNPNMNLLIAFLILTALLALGIAAIMLPRLRPSAFGRRLRIVGIALVLLGLLGFFSPKELWDGGYLQAEYQITFRYPDGRPVEGVQLRVEDQRGHTFYHYPVTDFLPDRSPTSDTAGRMVFHHASDGLEFGGKCWLFYGLIPVEEQPSPVYVCRFLQRGGEVYRVRYGEINSWRSGTWDEVEKVKRRWKRSQWPASQLLSTQDESYDAYHARILKIFDLDGNGKLNPEEGAAYGAGTRWRNEEAAIARLKGEDPEEEIEFPVVRRTVTIRPNPQ